MRSTINRLIEHLNASLGGNLSHPPAGGRLGWIWFCHLCRSRTYGACGPNPISYAEIEAYARLYRWPLEPHHVDMIMAMDRAWLAWARAGADGLPRTTQTITADAFDAVFG